jgi:hypothetical protein
LPSKNLSFLSSIQFVKQFKKDAKMPICSWKGCEFACEEMAAFQAHVTKHVQPQQQQQMNLDNQNEVGIQEEQNHGEPIAKKAKINEEGENKMTNGGGKLK